ncbi:MAG: hypothetical protein NVS2B5_25290 [Beijerinckiaceae bacterium]
MHLNPSICVEDRKLADIAADGVDRLDGLRHAWSDETAAAGWNSAILAALGGLRASREVPDGRGFNKILDDRSRRAYSASISDLQRFAPETITRKIERANIQQAFALETAQRLLVEQDNPKILAVGSYEDTAIEALRALGYTIAEVDPNVNGMSLVDYYIAAASQLRSYDLVLCVSVLEHVEDDIQFVRMISEFLKPGGTAILTVDFAERWHPRAAKPNVDHRLYTTRHICEKLMPAIGDCVLVDAPRWADGVEDFEYEGCKYGFAGFVFRKLDAVSIELASITPVWSEMLVEERRNTVRRDIRSTGNDKMTSIRRLFSRTH